MKKLLNIPEVKGPKRSSRKFMNCISGPPRAHSYFLPLGSSGLLTAPGAQGGSVTPACRGQESSVDMGQLASGTNCLTGVRTSVRTWARPTSPPAGVPSGPAPTPPLTRCPLLSPPCLLVRPLGWSSLELPQVSNQVFLELPPSPELAPCHRRGCRGAGLPLGEPGWWRLPAVPTPSSALVRGPG